MHQSVIIATFTIIDFRPKGVIVYRNDCIVLNKLYCILCRR